MMKLSIIIPSYKPKDYIFTCLNSIENQTLDSGLFEVLIILNGPKNPYYEAIEEYINRSDKTYSLLYTSFANVSNARNIGLNSARGQYITFIDDDDYISPDYLYELLKVSKYNLTPLANINNFIELNNKKIFVKSNLENKWNDLSQNKCYSLIKTASFFSNPVMKLFKREDIGDRRFNTDFSNGEDGLFMVSISDKLGKVKTTSSNAIYYRRERENSLSTSDKPKAYDIKVSIGLIKEMAKIYLKSPREYNFGFIIYRIAAEIVSTIKTIFK